MYLCARVIKRGERGTTSDGGERMLSSPFLYGEMEIHKTKRVTLPSGRGLLRENTKNEDDDEDDGDFIGNV